MTKKANEKENETMTKKANKQEKIPQEIEDIKNFLRKTGTLAEVIEFLGSHPENNWSLLRTQYQAEHEKWVKNQTCSVAKKLDEHEGSLSNEAQKFLENNQTVIEKLASSTIGTRQSAPVTVTEKLQDNRRLVVTCNSVRKNPLTFQESQAVNELKALLRQTFVKCYSLKDTVGLLTLRKRSIGLHHYKPKTGDFDYNISISIRDANKKESKEDAAKAQKRREKIEKARAKGQLALEKAKANNRTKEDAAKAAKRLENIEKARAKGQTPNKIAAVG